LAQTKVITLENATALSKRMLKTTVATQLTFWLEIQKLKFRKCKRQSKGIANQVANQSRSFTLSAVLLSHNKDAKCNVD